MKKEFMKKAVITLSVLIGMPLLGCATSEHGDRSVSSESHTSSGERAQLPTCREGETRNQIDGSCERLYKIDRPMRRGGK